MRSYGSLVRLAEAKYIQDMEKLILECKSIMKNIYSPVVSAFILELAKKRGSLQQLRDMLGIGLKVDDLRRIIMAKKYISPRMLVTFASRDMTRFIWEFPYEQRGRFGNIWQRFIFRLHRLLSWNRRS